MLRCFNSDGKSSIYRPPRGIFQEFLDEFSSLLENALFSKGRLLIAGDFNIHVNNPADGDALKFDSILNSMGLTQHVIGPTHSRGHTLDLVITIGLPTLVLVISNLTGCCHLTILHYISEQYQNYSKTRKYWYGVSSAKYYIIATSNYICATLQSVWSLIFNYLFFALNICICIS